MNHQISQLLLYSELFGSAVSTRDLFAGASLILGVTMMVIGLIACKKGMRRSNTSTPDTEMEHSPATPVAHEHSNAENLSQDLAPSLSEQPSLEDRPPLDPMGPTIPTNTLDALGATDEPKTTPTVPTDGVLLNSAGEIVAMGDSFRARFASSPPLPLPIPIGHLLTPAMAKPALAGIATLQLNPREILVQEGNFAEGAPASVSAFLGLNGENLYLALYPKAPARILVADDEPRYRMMVAHCLRRLGYAVEEGAHGKEAVDIARDWHPDLVLMDLNMPGMSGFEASRQMHAEQGEDTPSIVAISGMKRGNVRERCAASGIDSLVPKPFDLNRLTEIIEEQLQSEQLAA